ncbi:MAG: sigma-54 dependent transcriptional regulator, partial [Burkholderiaceae bacterium]|nr:sigma-54 dependent transcriptional regulator [Burkholderiaceae bacterium]
IASDDDRYFGFIGGSHTMQAVYHTIENAAVSKATIFITGESGTGKEVTADAIHRRSPRAANSLVALNCAAIPHNLLESEIFGHVKGAFTGAISDHQGAAKRAHGGTLFLDEICELDLNLQTKLLRFIQSGTFNPVGSTAVESVDVRFVCATNRDPWAEVQAGRFRQDLFYRLNVIRIVVPPLRERLDDVPAICRAVVERIARDAGVAAPPVLAPEAERRLLRHAFPGNVRELENLLHRALALAAGSTIGVDDLGLPDEAAADHAGPDAGPVALRGSAGAVGSVPLAAAADAAGEGPLPSDLVAYLDEVERRVLERALERHRYNRTAAGASLGLSLRQMRYRMARLGIGGDAAAAEPDAEPA